MKLDENYNSWVARQASENINRLPFKKLSHEMEMLYSSVLRLDQPNYYAYFYLKVKYFSIANETW